MPSVLPIDDSLKTKVIKQLEYYFSDINLRNDYFIRKMAEKDSGWLSIEALMKFNRLKSLVNNDRNCLIQALQSMKSDVIELSSDEDRIRRRVDKPVPQMDDQLKQSFAERTVIIKGVPKDTTLDELMEWSQKLGSVHSIRMKCMKKTRLFNGCAKIIFATKQMADTVVNQSVLKFNDSILTKCTKQSLIVLNRKPLDSKMADLTIEGVVEQKTTVSVDTSSQQTSVSSDLDGTVLQLKGMPRRVVAKEKTNGGKQFKEFFSTYGRVTYVTTDSSGNCLVQFKDQLSAQKVLDMNETYVDKQLVHTLVFNGKEVTARLLSTDEENSFWIRVNKRKEKKLKYKELKKNSKTNNKRKIRKRPNTSIGSGQEPKRQTPATA